MDTKPAYIFVYGTLLPPFDGYHARLLRDQADFVTFATMTGTLYNVGNYPAVTTKGDTKIKGAVYQTESSALLKELDKYEEVGCGFPFPQEYRKEQIKISTPNGTLVCLCYVYNLSVENLEIIESGDYAGFISK